MPIWLFAYGSLMWNPGFPYVESHPAVLRGWQRSFCVLSRRSRGSPLEPGLVLGLREGGSCHGLVFRLAPDNLDTTLAYLRDRELASGVYHTARVRARLPPRRVVRAETYVVNPAHPDHAGELPAAEIAERICRARGRSGTNAQYLFETVACLQRMGIHDAALVTLAEQVAHLLGEGGATSAGDNRNDGPHDDG